MKRNLPKIIALNLILCLINIVLFAKPFMGLTIGGVSALASALGVTDIFLSGLFFFYGNIRLLTARPKPKTLPVKDVKITTLEECTVSVKIYLDNNVKTYAHSLQQVLDQISRFKRKKTTIQSTLLDRFSETEMSFSKFAGAVLQIEDIMIQNIKSLLIRINAFDEEEYEQLLKQEEQNRLLARTGDKSNALRESRLEIYRQYMDFVERAVENNEEMLIRLDRLILEISKLNSLNPDEIANMDAMQEIDRLIRDTEFYK